MNRLVIVTLLTFPLVVNAQDVTVNGRNLGPLVKGFGMVEPIDPPSAPQSWSLQVITQGGVTGQGKGDFVIKSDGSAICYPATRFDASPRCDAPIALPTATLEPFANRLTATKSSKWNFSRFNDACSDCYKTLMIFSVREQDGDVRRVMSSWDSMTERGLPTELAEIYGAAAALIR